MNDPTFEGRASRRLLVTLLAALVVMTGMWAGPLRVDSAGADDPGRVRAAVSPASERMVADRDVRGAMRDVSAARLESGLTALVGFGTRNTLSSQTDPVRGIGAARDWIYDQFSDIAESADGRMSVELQTHERTIAGQTVPVTNVVATLEGVQEESKDRLYVLSAHYDTRCSGTNDGECDAPGANDDGSGTMAIIEAARVLAPLELDATLVFVAFAGEEQGLHGATYFAEQAIENDLNIQGVLNFDVVGNTIGGSGLSEPRAIRVLSEGVPTTETTAEGNRRRQVGGENDGPSRQLARFINTVSDTYTPDMRAWMVNRQDRFGRGGDQRPFLERGYTAVRFSEPYENYEQQHQTIRVVDGVVYGDLLEFVDFAYLARVTRLAVASAASLANGPAAPVNARISTSGVSGYDARVLWNAGTEPDIAGYEIVWRDSTSPVWTDFESFPVGTEGIVENLSKDNTMIGVRAVDIHGNKSPVSLAR